MIPPDISLEECLYCLACMQASRRFSDRRGKKHWGYQLWIVESRQFTSHIIVINVWASCIGDFIIRPEIQVPCEGTRE